MSVTEATVKNKTAKTKPYVLIKQCTKNKEIKKKERRNAIKFKKPAPDENATDTWVAPVETKTTNTKFSEMPKKTKAISIMNWREKQKIKCTGSPTIKDAKEQYLHKRLFMRAEWNEESTSSGLLVMNIKKKNATNGTVTNTAVKADVKENPTSDKIAMETAVKDLFLSSGANLDIKDQLKSKQPIIDSDLSVENPLYIESTMNENKRGVSTTTESILNSSVHSSSELKTIEEQEPSASGIMLKTDVKEIPFPTKITMMMDADEYFISGKPIKKRNVMKKILKLFPNLKKYCSMKHMEYMQVVFNRTAYLNHVYPKVFWHKCKCSISRVVDVVGRQTGKTVGLLVYMKCRRHVIIQPLCRFSPRHSNK